MKILTLFLFLLLGCWTASAQTKACDFRLEIYKYQPITKDEVVTAKGVTALLINSKTGKQIKPSKAEEHALFSNLREGSYEARVSMSGHKSTIKKIDLICDLMPEQTATSEVIFLWEGNAKETVAMYGTAFVIGARDDASSVQPSSIAPAALQKEIVNGKAASLVRPPYPPAAAAIRASGEVQVQVVIDELGRVVTARAVSGHALLRAASEKAARESKFMTTMLEGMPVRVTGIIVYNFSGR